MLRILIRKCFKGFLPRRIFQDFATIEMPCRAIVCKWHRLQYPHIDIPVFKSHSFPASFTAPGQKRQYYYYNSVIDRENEKFQLRLFRKQFKLFFNCFCRFVVVAAVAPGNGCCFTSLPLSLRTASFVYYFVYLSKPHLSLRTR